MARVGDVAGGGGHGGTPLPPEKKTKPKKAPAKAAPKKLEGKNWLPKNTRDVADHPAPEAVLQKLGLPSEDGRRIYRASELGNCITALAALAGGIDAADMPQVLHKALQEGTDNEPIILEKVRAAHNLRSVTFPELSDLKEKGVIAGYEPKMKQVQVRINVGTGAMIRAHLDDLMVGVDAPIWTEEGRANLVCIEAKAFGDALWKEWQRHKLAYTGFEKYRWQASVSMCATGYPMLFVVGHKDDDGVVQEIDAEMLAEPPFSLGQMKARVMKADKYAAIGEVPDCDSPQWPCPVYFLPQHPDKEEAPEIEDEELGDLCARHVAFHNDEKEAKKERDWVKSKIDKLVAERGYKRGEKVKVASTVGEVYEFEWVVQPVEEFVQKASTRSYPSVKLA